MSPDDHDTIGNAPTIGGDGAGQILSGRYRIVRELGSGGMGMVYLAEDMELDDMPVAVKVLPTLLARNTRAIANLRREAQTSLKLSHPNIVRLHTFQSDEQIKYLVMEYVDGENLEERISSQGVLSVEETIKVFTQVAAGLDFAHGRNVLHRDIKPANILLDKDGQAKLADFGIARQLKDSMTRITGNETSGTLLYMAPEQFRGGEPDHRSDIYSLGASIYESISGRPPFWRGSIEYQVMNEQPARLEKLSEKQNAALLKALAKDVEKRQSSAKQLLVDFGVDAKGLHWDASLKKQPTDALGDSAKGDTAGAKQPEQKRAKTNLVVAIIFLLVIVLAVLWGVPRYRQYQQGALEADLKEATQAAAVGNMKIVLDLMGKYPNNPDFAALRPIAFEKLKLQYRPVSVRKSDREWNEMLNKRVHVAGTLVYNLSPRKDGKLWSCVHVPVSGDDYRYVELFFPEAMGLASVLEGQGLVQGSDVRMYGFLTKLEKNLLAKNKYALDPVEGWEIAGREEKPTKTAPAETQKEPEPALDGRFQTYFDAGYTYEAKEDWAKAIEAYEKTLTFNPDDQDTKDHLATCQHNMYLAQGAEAEKTDDLDGAIEGYSKALSFKQVPSTKIRLEQAKTTLTEKIAAQGRQQEYDKWFKKAQAAEADGDLSAAAKFYERAQGYTEESLRAKIESLRRQIAENEKLAKFTGLLAQAKAKDSKKTGKEALRLLDEALVLYPENGEASALRKKIGGYYHKAGDVIINSIGMKLVYIPPGAFMMGDTLSPEEVDRRWPGGQIDWYKVAHPRHRVRLTEGFWLGVTEVTRGQFDRFVRETNYRTDAENQGTAWALKDNKWGEQSGVNWRNPLFQQGDDHPVVCVSYNDAMAFCEWLSKKDSKTYALPTEAQWEYTCRAGSDTTTWYWGDNESGAQGHANVPSEGESVNWTYKFKGVRDGYTYTSPVASFSANEFGLYDTIGNVWEWCADWYGDDYYANSPGSDPSGPSSGTSRVLRGGSWSNAPRSCRAANRSRYAPDARSDVIGFRVCVSSLLLDFQ